jgi:gamma-glutamyltranspeptidase
MPTYVTDGLTSLGHDVAWGQEGISHGIVQLIQFDEEKGVKMGASDPRGDGHAAAI